VAGSRLNRPIKGHAGQHARREVVFKQPPPTHSLVGRNTRNLGSPHHKGVGERRVELERKKIGGTGSVSRYFREARIS